MNNRFLITLAIAAFSLIQANSQDSAEIAIFLDSADCTSNRVCYKIGVRMTDTSEYLADQIYRIYYDSKYAVIDESSVKSLLDNNYYSDATVKLHVSGINASSIGGPLSFEEDLGFLNYVITIFNLDFDSTQSRHTEWRYTSSFCFDVQSEMWDDPLKHMNLVLGRKEMTSAYAPAYTLVSSINQDSKFGPRELTNHGDINENSGKEAYLNGSCQSESNESYLYEVSGQIIKPDRSPLANVRVQLNGYEGVSSSTDEYGQYLLEGFSPFSYEVRPEKSDDILQDIDEEDFNLLMAYIRGDTVFSDPLQFLAADVNEDQVIDVEDAFTLFSVMTGSAEHFPNNRSYLFIPAETPMPSVESGNVLLSPWSNSLFLSDLSEDMTDLDFIAVKIGDVTGSTCSTCVKQKELSRYAASGRSSKRSLSVGVYPNPATNFLQVVFDAHDFKDRVTYRLVSTSGEIIVLNELPLKNDQELLRIPVASLPSGNYFLNLTDGQVSSTEMVSIQH
jgi:hypothetical protein